MKIFGDEVHPNCQQVTTKYEEVTRPPARGIVPTIEMIALFKPPPSTYATSVYHVLH